MTNPVEVPVEVERRFPLSWLTVTGVKLLAVAA
jgi:hypothetical protein